MILILCGSLSEKSANRTLLHWLRNQISGWQVTESHALHQLPPFNPDRLPEPPAPVQDFLQSLLTASGLILCTPEYAMAMLGALKNALEWTVASAALSGLPVMLVTASTVGERTHASLLHTLRTIEAQVPEEIAIHIPFIKAKLREDGSPEPTTAVKLLEALAPFLALAAARKTASGTGLPQSGKE